MAVTYKSDLASYRRYYKVLEEMAQKPKNRAYTTTVFSFLAISLFSWYAIRPTLQTILFLRREIADKTDINKKMEEKIGNLIQAQAAYQTIEADVPLLSDALPADPETVSLVQSIRNLAVDAGTAISSIQISSVPILQIERETTDKPQASSVQSVTEFKTKSFAFSIVVVGDYIQLKTFLSGLIAMRRIVAVDSMNFAVARDEVVEGATGKLLRLVLKVHSYYLSKQ